MTSMSQPKSIQYLSNLFDEDTCSRFNYFSNKGLKVQLVEYEATDDFIKTANSPNSKFSIPDELVEQVYTYDDIKLFKIHLMEPHELTAGQSHPPPVRSGPGVSFYIGFAIDASHYKVMSLEFDESKDFVISIQTIREFFLEIFKMTYFNICDVLNYDMLIRARHIQDPEIIPGAPTHKCKTKPFTNNVKVEKARQEYGIQYGTPKRTFLFKNGFDPKKYNKNITIARNGTYTITLENLDENTFLRLSDQYFKKSIALEPTKHMTEKRRYLIRHGFDYKVYEKNVSIKRNLEADVFMIKIPNLSTEEFLELANEFFDRSTSPTYP